MRDDIVEGTWDKKRLFIESVIAIICAFIGVMFGKASNTYYYNGQKITEAELNAIMAENAEYKNSYDTLVKDNETLTVKIESLSTDNKNYKDKNDELKKENELMKSELSNIPNIEFKSRGFIIDGADKVINKNNSSIILNGRNYYSEDIIKALLPQNSNLTISDDNIYIGKIIADKANLFDQKVMDQKNCEIQNTATDSYKNTYTNILFMKTNGVPSNHDYIIYVLNGGYSWMRFSAAIRDTAVLDKKGVLTIKADDQVVYTSDNLNKKTKLFTESDIPINNCTLLTIEYNSEEKNGCIISEAFVYN